MAKILSIKKTKKKNHDTPNFVPTGYQQIDNIVEKYYGTLPFQETVMQLFASVAQVDFGDADKVRKIIGKKLDPNDPKSVKIFTETKDMFFNGGKNQNIDEDTLNEWWEKIIANAGYSFNLSHAVAYSITSYEQLWYLHNYPLEYCSVMINNTKPEEFNTWALLLYKSGFSISPPHVNQSKKIPVINDNKDSILLPLSSIVGLGIKAEESILENAPYTSIKDFAERSGANIQIMCKLFVLNAFKGLEGEFSDLGTGLEFVDRSTAYLFFEKKSGKDEIKYKFHKDTLDIDLLRIVLPDKRLSGEITKYTSLGYDIHSIQDIKVEERDRSKGKGTFTRHSYFDSKIGKPKSLFYMNEWGWKKVGLSPNDITVGSVVAVKLNTYKYAEDLIVIG